jgi:ubiquinone/menaquinone biosynthesis C-methylase UbiE
MADGVSEASTADRASASEPGGDGSGAQPQGEHGLDPIRELFETVADTYDDVGVDFFQPIAQRLVAELDLEPGERVLDVGCGRGAVLVEAGKAVGGRGKVVGVDFAPRMVELALKAAAAADIEADVFVGDAVQPHVEAPFDVVTSSLVLFFLPDPLAALVVWRALLRPEGRIGVTTFGPYNEEWQGVDAVFRPFLPPQMVDPRTTSETSPFSSDENMEALLRQAGFVDVRTVTTTVPVRFDDHEHWRRWTMSQGQRRMWAVVPDDRRDEVMAQARDALDAGRRSDGRLGFDQTVRYTLGRA